MSYPQNTITQDEYDALKITLAARYKEIERLRALVKDAYEEGWDDGVYAVETDGGCWLASASRAALQPKEGV